MALKVLKRGLWMLAGDRWSGWGFRVYECIHVVSSDFCFGMKATSGLAAKVIRAMLIEVRVDDFLYNRYVIFLLNGWQST